MDIAIKFMVVASCCALLSGCVNRTITVRPGYKSTITGELMGTNPADVKVVETKRVWIWQKEFRNP